MRLLDLDAFLDSTRDGGAQGGDSIPANVVIKDPVKFKVVLHEEIRPPVEELDALLSREFIIKDGIPYTQKETRMPGIFKKIEFNLLKDAGIDMGSYEEELEPWLEDIEYECIHGFPEGALLLEDHVPVFHVERGRIVQVEFWRERGDKAGQECAGNREFNNILLKNVEEHAWDDLISKFTDPKDMECD